MSYKAHLFICTNSPDRTGKCGSKNSEELRKRLKDRCKKEFAPGALRVNSSGCLGACENGIAAVLYPQQEWFLNLTLDSGEDTLIEALRKALPEDKITEPITPEKDK
jgi:predicted metal-binding protein